MKQLPSITWPIALLASALLLTPLNEGSMGYVLSVVAALAVGVSLWSQGAMRQQEQQQALTAQNATQQLALNQMQAQETAVVAKLQQQQEVIEQQAVALLQGTVNSDKQQEQRVATLLQQLTVSQVAEAKRHEQLLAQLAEMQQQHKASYEQTAQFSKTVAEYLTTVTTQQEQTQQLHRDDTAKLIENILLIRSACKGITKTIEELADNQEQQTKQVTATIEDQLEAIEEVLGQYSDNIENHTEKLQQLTDVLVDECLPIMEATSDVVESLEKSSLYLEANIQEITSSKMEERKQALQMQEDILKQLV